MEKIAFLELIANVSVILGLTLVIEARKLASTWRLKSENKSRVFKSYALLFAATLLFVVFSNTIITLIPVSSSWKIYAVSTAIIALFFLVSFMPIGKIFSLGTINFDRTRRLSKSSLKELAAIISELDSKETSILASIESLTASEKEALGTLDDLLRRRVATLGDLMVGQAIQSKIAEARLFHETALRRINRLKDRVTQLKSGKYSAKSIKSLQAELNAVTF